ncbi:MAG TPA: S9 family peptidase [Blastocatellia bacterium]|nr:S9 family peptidase [Blastocatellia bacterium]
MNKQSLRILVVTLFVIVGTSLPAFGQAKQRLLDKDTFMDMESVGTPAISPDGKRVVFSRTWVDKMKDQYRSNLWIADIDGSRIRELTNGSWRDSSPVWSPDGKRIAFLSDRDGTNQIHVMWADTGELAQLTRVEDAPGNLRWSPDGKQIAFTMKIEDNTPILAVRLPERPKGAQWATPAKIIDRLSWRSDGVGEVSAGFTQVFVIDSMVGGTPRQITNGKYNHGSPSWSADSKTIYISGIRKPDAEYLRGDSEIYAINLATLDIKPLTDRNGPDNNPIVSPDGKWITYIGYDQKHYTNHISSIYLMDTNGGSKKLWAGELYSTPQEIQWASDSKGIYFAVEEKGSVTLYSLSLDGKMKALTQGVQFLNGFSVAENGQAVAVRSSFKEPGTLVAFKVNDGTNMKKIVDVNEGLLSNVKMGDAEEIWYSSKDGLKVQGWIIKPANFDPGKKYPMVLWIHGGPWSMYSVAFNWAFQNFSAMGYVVLFSNPRGSTGYGQEFVNGIQYSYPGKDFDDLMAGVDTAIAKGYVDEKNLFVCGGSGGGLLTAWTVGHTDRFAAAVAMRPVIDWHSFVAITDGPNWYDQFTKYPWEDAEQFAVRSPLNYVANVKTPTMLMTGEADLRTPIGQTEEFYRALKLLHKETLMVRMPDEFHGWRRPSHQLLQQLYLMAWFDKHKTTNNGMAGQ